MQKRHATVIGLALVLAACSAGPAQSPTTTPTQRGTASTPRPTSVPAVASEGPSAVPCIGTDAVSALAIDVEFAAPSSNTLFGILLEAELLDGTPVSVEHQGEPSIQDLRSVLGGVEMEATMTVDDGSTVIADIVPSAHLSVDGGLETLTLPARVDGTKLVLTFPDIDATGYLNLRLDYRDACYRLATFATGRVRIGSIATVATCPAEESDALEAYLKNLHGELLVLVDETPVPSGIEEGEWPWLAGNFATDSGSLFGMWNREAAPIRGGAGDRLVFRLGGADAGLTGMMTRFYSRSDAVHEFEREIEPVVTRTPKVQDDGTVLLRLPDQPGRYVAFTSFAWNTPCLIATSVANFEVDVE